MSEEEELRLQERDERIKKQLELELRDIDRDLGDYERRINDLKLRKHRIAKAVKDELWYGLRDILDPDDVESLCNISPQNLFQE